MFGRSDGPQNPLRVVAIQAAIPSGSGPRNPSVPPAACRIKEAKHTTATAPFKISSGRLELKGASTRPTACSEHFWRR